MTPEGWKRVAEQRQRDREEFRIEQRRAALPAFVGIACLLAGLIGGGMLIVALIEGRL